MMIDITLKNYRCFSDGQPACFQLRPGFTALVGTNNSGKTSLLKFLSEFRSLFDLLSLPGGNLIPALSNLASFNFPREVMDSREIFHNGNDRDIEIRVALDIAGAQPGLPALPSRCEVIVPRGTNQFKCKLFLTDGILDISKGPLAFPGPQNLCLAQND